MNFNYAVALIFATAISAGITMIAWKRRDTPGASGLMIFMLAEAVWTATYAVRWMVAEPAAEHFWLDATYLGVAFNATFMLIFTLQFTGHSRLLTRRNLKLSAIVPLVTLLLLWTDEWHGLFFWGGKITDTNQIGGPWFWIFVFYSYTQILFVIFLLVQEYLRAFNLYRRQIGSLLFAACLPVVDNILGLAGFRPFPNLDLTPFIFTVSGLIYAYALFGLRMLDIVPVARHKMVDEMADGVIVLDANRRIVDVNLAVQRLIGIATNAIGQLAVDVLDARLHLELTSGSKVSSLMELRVSENPPCDIEFRVSPLLDHRQGITGHLLVLHDITERKQAEEKKWKADGWLRTLFVAIEQSPVITLITNSEGVIVYVNPKFTETTGYTAEEVIGQNPRILKSEFKSLSEYQELWDTILSGQNWHGNFLNKKKNGELYWESATISPVKDGQGAITHFLAVKEDITERKQAEEALQKNAAELECANSRLENAISNANELTAQAILAQKTIREREARYQAVFDTANDAIISADGEGNIVDWNPRAERMFGYSKIEACGQPTTFVMPTRFHEGHLSGMERVQTGGEEHIIGKAVEMEGRRKDGSEFPLELSLSEWQVADQKFFAATIRDITERKQAEEALQWRDSIINSLAFTAAQFLKNRGWEDSIQTVLERFAQAIQVEKTLVYQNQVGENTSLIAVRQFSWEKFRNTAAQADFFNLEINLPRQWADQMAAGHIISGPMASTVGDSAPISAGYPGSIALVPVFVGRKWWGFFACLDSCEDRLWTPDEIESIKTTADILGTEIQRSDVEKALRLSEAHYRAMLSAIPDLIYRYTRDGTITAFNNSNGGDSQIGLNIRQVFSAEIADRTIELIQFALDTKTAQTLEFELPDPEGTQAFEARMVVSGDQEVLAIVRNVSERARLEQMKSDFINRAAHDLRTPLTTATMMADLIYEGGSDDELARYWQIFRSELKRETALIEKLLTVGRLESGEYQIKKQAIQIKTSLLSVLEGIRALASSRSIRLNENIPDGLPVIMADSLALQQVFMNLLSNAVKFTPVEGRIDLAVRETKAGVEVSIQDTGIGIPIKDLPNLFQRFFRASNAIANEIQGTGVGLFIVKAIVEQHYGHIHVDSLPGKGTLITVWLPSVREDGEALDHSHLDFDVVERAR